MVIIGCSEKTMELKALELVKKSNVLGGNLSVEDNIKDFLGREKGKVRPLGWDVKKKSNQIFLVSYKYKTHSFEEGVGELGYFFEADLVNKVVRNVTNNYISGMKRLLSPAYHDEKELVEEIFSEDAIVNFSEKSGTY